MWKVIICLTIFLTIFNKAEACQARRMGLPKEMIITEEQQLAALRAGVPEPTWTPYQHSYLREIVTHNAKVEAHSIIVIPTTDVALSLFEYVWSPTMWPRYNRPADTCSSKTSSTTPEPTAEP